MLATLSWTLMQAGGGGGFGGGGGGGGGFGGGGGDGDGLFWILYMLFRLVVRAPLIGIPVVIVLVILVVASSKRGVHRVQERSIGRHRDVRERAPAVGTAALLAGDPAFDEAAFLQRVGQAFAKAQSAWCAQDLEVLAPFVSDGVFERFSLQVEEQRKEGWRQGMSGLAVGALQVVECELGSVFETLSVRIPFRCDIHRIQIETGRRISGSQLPKDHFVECWTFLRRRGAKTLTTQGLIEGQCPNCGATLSMRQSARCETCEAQVRSGEFDWVLTEITQESVWRPRAASDVPGWDAYAEADPGLSLALFEDRTSVAFWRLRLAETQGTAGPIAGVAMESLCEQLQARFDPDAESGPRHASLDVAVGAVEVLGVIRGEDLDRALVEVVWDGRSLRIHRDGKRQASEGRQLARSLFVFARKAGQTTSTKGTFTTAHCQSCGAHDTGQLSPLCPYCEEPRRGDASTWLLEEVVARNTPFAKALIAEAGGAAPTVERAPVPRQLLIWAASLAGADGTLDPEERAILADLAKRTGVATETVFSLTPKELGLEQWDADAPPAGPVDTDEARAWLQALVAMALADGHIQKAEKRWLTSAAERLGFAKADLKLMINKERTRLYRAGKSVRVDEE